MEPSRQSTGSQGSAETMGGGKGKDGREVTPTWGPLGGRWSERDEGVSQAVGSLCGSCLGWWLSYCCAEREVAWVSREDEGSLWQ